TFAIHIAMPSSPQKPRTPAIRAMMRNIRDQRSMGGLLPWERPERKLAFQPRHAHLERGVGAPLRGRPSYGSERGPSPDPAQGGHGGPPLQRGLRPFGDLARLEAARADAHALRGLADEHLHPQDVGLEGALLAARDADSDA